PHRGHGPGSTGSATTAAAHRPPAADPPTRASGPARVPPPPRRRPNGPTWTLHRRGPGTDRPLWTRRRARRTVEPARTARPPRGVRPIGRPGEAPPARGSRRAP